VLERARDVFWNNGYAATSLDDLAAATSLSRPSLYAAFGDKHALYLRALEENRNWSVEGIRQRLAGGGPLREALHDFLIDAAASALGGDVGARGCFVVCTALTESLRDPETRAVAAGYVAEVDRVFRDRFERSRGELNRSVDPASAAVASAMLQTLAVRARTGSDREELAGVARAAVIAICGLDDAGVGS
jgi:TetR/AcrR family transcriptional regulator, copper-responsive repressor